MRKMLEKKTQEDEKARKAETPEAAQDPELLRQRGPTPGTFPTGPGSRPAPTRRPEFHEFRDSEKSAPSEGKLSKVRGRHLSRVVEWFAEPALDKEILGSIPSELLF